MRHLRLDDTILILVGLLGGGAASSLIVHRSGAVLSLALPMLPSGEQVRQWRTLPAYMFGAGAIGVVLYLTISRTLPTSARPPPRR